MDTKPDVTASGNRRGTHLQAGAMLAFIAVSILITIRSLTTLPAADSESTVQFDAMQPVALDLGTAPNAGSRTATIGIVMFSDFECPFCAAFSRNVFPTLKRRFIDTGQVRLSFKHFPLVAIHPQALRIAEIAACLSDHDTFWRATDLLFMQTRSLASVTPASLASIIGVEPRGLELCIAEHGKRAVYADMEQGQTLGLRGTPTFFVGPIEGNSVRAIRRLTGFATVPSFAEVLADVRNHQE